MNRLDRIGPLQAGEGWSIERVLGPSPLFGANGMKWGPDGRLVVAEAFGSRISTIEPESGRCEILLEQGSAIRSPDDVAFDTHGVLYVTEVMVERVSARLPDGSTRVIAENVPVANGITSLGDRIFMDEFRPGGRVVELYADGRAPRVIAKDLSFPNALSAGPDDHLYFPAVVDGEIWRVPIAGGHAERFVTGLDHPTAVKFDRDGRLTTVQAGNGEIARIDLQSRAKTKIANVRPGIDNFAFSPQGRMFVSHFVDGGVAEILGDGSERVLVAPGLIGPFGLAAASGGRVIVADGVSLVEVAPGGRTTRLGQLLQPGWPGFVRGVACDSSGAIFVANTGGDVVRFRPGEPETIATGLGEIYGLAVLGDGSVLAVDRAEGRVLRLAKGDASVVARGLAKPTGLAVGEDGAIFVSEAGNGRVVRVDGGITSVIDGLDDPHGLAAASGVVYVVDRAGKTVTSRTASGQRRIVASGLPVGEAPGIAPQSLPGIPSLLGGPIAAFTGLAVAADGALLVAADADGSVLRIARAD